MITRTNQKQRDNARKVLEKGVRLKVRQTLLLLADLDDTETERARLDALSTKTFKRWMEAVQFKEKLEKQIRDMELHQQEEDR